MGNQKSAYLPITQPYNISMGVVCQHTLLEGSFQVYPADTIGSVTVVASNGSGSINVTTPVATGHGMSICSFRADTSQLGHTFVQLRIQTDGGTAYQEFSYSVKERSAFKQALLICDSPYCHSTSRHAAQSVRAMIGELLLPTDYTRIIPDDLSSYQALLFHGYSLSNMSIDQIRAVQDSIDMGSRVIILADYFFGDTVEKANQISSRYGVVLDNSDCDETVCTSHEIINDYATQGVNRLFFFRHSLIRITDAAKFLVRDPNTDNRGIIAVSGPSSNLFVIGVSTLERALFASWPFDNGRMLANLLVDNRQDFDCSQ